MGGLGPGLDPPSCPGLQAPSHSSFTLQPQRQVVAGWWLGDTQKDGGLLAKDSAQPLPLLVTLAILVQTLPGDPFSHPVSGLLGFWTVGLSSSDLMGFGSGQRGPTALCRDVWMPRGDVCSVDSVPSLHHGVGGGVSSGTLAGCFSFLKPGALALPRECPSPNTCP